MMRLGPMGEDWAFERKASGRHYTPKLLADFLASKLGERWRREGGNGRIRLLDPAVGDGELLCSILAALEDRDSRIEVFGFDMDPRALQAAGRRLQAAHPGCSYSLRHEDFLDFTLKRYRDCGADAGFDMVISNPPYVRTQVLGSAKSRKLAREFDLAGRIDLYQAFLRAIARVLKPGGLAGIIVSNRFMTTEAGAAVRRSILEDFDVRQVWDLGDTRLFKAAVLPAILIMIKKKGRSEKGKARFTSIYSIKDGKAGDTAANVVQALSMKGIIRVEGGGLFQVRQGYLERGVGASSIWRLSDKDSRRWLAAVDRNTFCTFKDLLRIRVGVKTCADAIFIRDDWDTLSEAEKPELLFPLATHHAARRYKALPGLSHRIVYPHEACEGRCRAVDLDRYPKTLAYLSRHRGRLERREYLGRAGRQWYEIWVAQEPDLWQCPKLVFVDICEKPTFWMDLDGSIVNGDCYWLIEQRGRRSEPLWLALGVANSSFIEQYYDIHFPNRLYAGRRRFIKQYVERFPLPDPESLQGRRIAAMAEEIFTLTDRADTAELEKELDRLVRKTFGV